MELIVRTGLATAPKKTYSQVMDTFFIYFIGIISSLGFLLLLFTILKKSSKNVTTLSQNPVFRGERGKKQQVLLIVLILAAIVAVELIS
jgi:hypothetical protein